MKNKYFKRMAKDFLANKEKDYVKRYYSFDNKQIGKLPYLSKYQTPEIEERIRGLLLDYYNVYVDEDDLIYCILEDGEILIGGPKNE